MDMEPGKEIQEIPSSPSNDLENLVLGADRSNLFRFRFMDMEPEEEKQEIPTITSGAICLDQAQVNIANRLDGLMAPLFWAFHRQKSEVAIEKEVIGKISSIVAEEVRNSSMELPKGENLRDMISQFVDLTRMEKYLTTSRWVMMEPHWDLISVCRTLRCCKSDIVDRVTAELSLLRQARVNIASQLDRLTGRLLDNEPEEVIEEISSIVAEEVRNSSTELPKRENLRNTIISRFVDLDQMEKIIAKRRREKIEMGDAVRIECSDQEVKGAFETLKCFESDIVLQVAKKLRLSEQIDCTYDFMRSYEVNRLNSNPCQLRYYRNEIRRTLRLTEQMLRDVERSTTNFGRYVKVELKKFKDYFLNLIEQWNDKAQENGVESSEERSKAQSKGMIFKRNTLRKQHNSQRDDPKELFPDLKELETILEDCVFNLPQLVSFIIIYGLLEDLTNKDTIMDEKMLMISNQGCGQAHKLSVVGNTPIIVI